MKTSDSLRIGVPWMKSVISCSLWYKRNDPDGSCRMKAGDIDIFFKRSGSGGPVLLLHGGLMVHQEWSAQVPFLSRYYQVIAPDSRGHGRTTTGSRPLDYRQMARDTITLIEQLGCGRVAIVGSSDGAITAMTVATWRPDLVSGLVLMGVCHNVEQYDRKVREASDRFLNPYSAVMLGLRIMHRSMKLHDPGQKRFFSDMRQLWDTLPDLTEDELAGIHAPTLVICGDRDEFLAREDDPLGIFKETAAAIPGAELEVIYGGGHTLASSRPDSVNELILGFLSRIEHGEPGPDGRDSPVTAGRPAGKEACRASM